MEIRAIYEFCLEIKPFILFDAAVDGREKVCCVGYEWHCCDPKCDCQLANIMIHEVSSGRGLTQLAYGWRNYDYYIKEGFIKSEVQGFVNGGLSFLEPRDEQNKAILAGFKDWLLKDKAQKKQLFMDRYRKFKSVAKTKKFSEEKDLNIFFESMYELLEKGKLEEFISGAKR